MTDRRGWLTGSGWIPWQQVQEIVGEAHCVWSDLAGTHVGPLPDSVPDATHLWGWDASRLYRVRIDRDAAIVASLDSRHLDGALEVTINESKGSSWDVPYIKVGDVAETTWRLSEVVDGAGMVFVRQQTNGVEQA